MEQGTSSSRPYPQTMNPHSDLLHLLCRGHTFTYRGPSRMSHHRQFSRNWVGRGYLVAVTGSIPGGKKKHGTVDFLGLCSDQQLSFYTLLDRASFPHYNNAKITSVASFLVLGGGGGKTPKCTDKNNICIYIAQASEASERLRNIYFQDSKYICIQCHIQSMRFPLITYGMALYVYTTYWQDTKIKRNLWICERA